MLIIGQNVEIWKVLSPLGIPTLCTFVITFLTVFIRRVVKDSWSLRTSCWSLMIRKYWISRFSFPSESVDTVTVSLPVLVMILNSRSHDFVDPRLLNLHLSPELPGSAELRKELEQGCWLVCADECGGTRSHDLSSLLERPLSFANGGGPADGDEGFTSWHLCVRVYSLTRSGPADHHRHHSLEAVSSQKMLHQT